MLNPNTSARRKLVAVLVAALAALIGSCGYPSDVAPFCDEAVPVVDGQTPNRGELENLKQLAIQHLPAETSSPLVVELDLLWAALQGGSNEGYSTSPVAELIGDVCGARVRAITSGPPLIGEGDESPPALGR